MGVRGSNYRGIALDVVQKNSQVVEDEQIKELFKKKEYFCNQIQKVAGLGSYIFNAQTGAWTSSPILDKIFGIDKEYKRNVKNWIKIVSPDQRKEMEDYFIGKVLGNRERFDKEYKIVRISDGETRWVHGLGDLIFNKSGGVNQMLGTIQDITERKKYELALKKSEQKYRDLIANMLDAFVIVSMDGKIIEFNDIYMKMVGYKGSELKKMTYVDLTPKKWHKLERKIINEQLLKTGFTDLYEKEYRRKDGSVFPVELRTYLIRDENRKPQSMWAIIRDISERKKVEIKLIEEKEKLRSILENTRHGIALTDETAVFTQANPFFCKLLRYSEEELKMKSFKDITYPADLLESVGEVRRLQSGKIATINLEKRYVTKDKEIIWGKVNVSLVRDEKGKIVNHVISLEDITSLKKVEEDLRKSRNQLSAVLMNMSDAVCVVDDKNRIILINKALKRLSGYKESQLIGSKFGDKIVILSEKRGEQMFPEETFDFTKETELERGDGLLLTADKQKIPVEGKYSPILNNGKFLGGVIVGRNATQERSTDRMRTDFISLASHQLRTPLTGIKWFVELIIDQVDKLKKDDLVNYVKRIKESNERLINLVNDLLQVSRIESGKLKILMVRDIGIKMILEKAIDDQMGLIEEQKIRIFGVDKIPKDICMEGDETQLIQIFGNIINNSIKYSPSGSRIDIKIAKRLKKKIILVVIDHGVGIPENQKKKLFQRFFRGDNVSKDVPGSGLGLYVVKSMLENHGGKIWIKSTEGKGTKVFVELPISIMRKAKA